MRRSRLRRDDLNHVLRLQWPVRCLRCSKRQYVFWHRAVRATSSKMPHEPELPSHESWQNFTSGQRPLIRTGKRDEGQR